MTLRDRVAGVDFSGARNAGKNIWIATGRTSPKGVRIEDVRPAADLPGGGIAFEAAVEALVSHVADLHGHLIGFDFPFSLPAELIEERNWVSFVRSFSDRYGTPDEFRDACRRVTNGKELKRKTDIEARVPWCAYNLRLYRQTWAGIRHVLNPLVTVHGARVIPVQEERSGTPLIAEICPASFLKKEDLYKPYKGRGSALRDARANIMRQLTRRGLLAPIRGKMRHTILENTGGDALDAVLSAISAAHVTDPLPRDRYDRIECRVYF